ncbi:MAG: hypothetical protein JWM19_1004 [Actinomycetia bacterium]|nr:hypothetical protein [Actinomycetes bacterium]
MNAPKSPLNPTTHSVGFTAKLVTVQSVSPDGQTALTVDRQNTQAQVPMLVQRSKGPLPQPGETWILTQDLGMWTFAAYAGKSAADFGASAGSAGRVTASRTAPAGPSAGDVWVNLADANALLRWTGTAWAAMQLGTAALAPASVTAAVIAPGAITAVQLAAQAGITAEQVAFTAGDIGGTRVVTGTSQPAQPTAGELWIDPDHGNALYAWNGDEWTPLQFGALAIQDGSLTAVQLAAQAGITAEQVAFSVTDIGGTAITFSATGPVGPNDGDLWYDSSHGYSLSQWNGSSWVPYKFGTGAIATGTITAALIAANTITAAQVAAGTITGNEIAARVALSAPVIVGGTITGGQFIGDGTGEEILMYSGTPAAGNLIFSLVSAGATDEAGNQVLDGFTNYSNLGGGQWIAVSTFDGEVTAYANTAGVESGWTQLAQTQYGGSGLSSGTLNFIADAIGINGNSVFLTGAVNATGGTASSPTVITTDTPHVLALLHGWAGGPLRYWLTGHDSVRVIGTVNPAAMTSNTIGVIAGIYVPTVGGDFDIVAHTSTPPTQGLFARVDNSGNLIAINATTGSGIFGIDIDCPLH